MKKIINKNVIFNFILGMLLCSGIVYAVNYKANDISYTKEGWEVDNVNEALDSLYDKTLNSANIKNGLSLATHLHSGHPSQINVSGYKTLTVSNESTTLSITLTADDGTVLSTTSSRGQIIDVSNYDYVIAKFTTYSDSTFASFKYILNY